MNKVLMLGGAGFIGSKLVGMLLSPEPKYSNNIYKLTVMDNLLYDKTSLLPYCDDKAFNFVYGDVRNHNELHKQIKEHDVIINLAALVGADLCKKNPIDAVEVNQKTNEFISVVKSKEQLIIYPNTNSGYSGTENNMIKVLTEEDIL